MAYSADYVVRYGECDTQGIVFNSHYLAYMDDAVDVWLRALNPQFERLGWEVMLKKTELLWHASAAINDTFTLDCQVSRWGNTSFDMSFVGSVADKHCLDGSITYVVVDTTEHRPMPVPDELRAHFG